MIDTSMHPCFSDGCSSAYRIHLPVSEKCNLKCNFCSHKFVVQEHTSAHPGRCADVLTPTEALKRLFKMKKKHPNISVVGFAGPGDNLYNPETFTTLKLIRHFFPEIILCVSTNGVLLAEKLPLLLRYQVTHVTVTINALNPEIGAIIYKHAFDGNTYLFGEKAAAWIIQKQLEGIHQASQAGISVKVNSVFVPGINDNDMLPLAKVICKKGAELMNIIPMIPSSAFKHRLAPTHKELNRIRELCRPIIRQMVNCQQCNAEACGPVPCRKTKVHRPGPKHLRHAALM